MKIAITSNGPEPDSPMDMRLGRCPYLLIVETDDMSCESVVNPHASESGGVGTRVASLLADRGVEAVLTEQCGPHARSALDAAGIRMVGLCAETVRQAVEAFMNGTDDDGSTEAQSSPTTDAASVAPGGQARGASDESPDHQRGCGRGRRMGRRRARRRRRHRCRFGDVK